MSGADISAPAIAFARATYPSDAQFTLQGITDLSRHASGAFDVTLTSEVLEHIKEYGKADLAMSELRRITRPGGVVVVATPNPEMPKHHGFSYEGEAPGIRALGPVSIDTGLLHSTHSWVAVGINGPRQKGSPGGSWMLARPRGRAATSSRPG